MKIINQGEIKEVSGEELIETGFITDAYKKPISVGKTYEIKIDHKTKKYTVLSKEDWHIKKSYELGLEILKQGGLISWANYGCRLGFLEKNTDCIEDVEEMIKVFNAREDYEKSKIMLDELNKLKQIKE